MNKAKIILALMLAISFGLAGCKEDRSQENAKFAELEAKCQELTNTNDEGHVYNAIVGKIIKDKIVVITNHRASGMIKRLEIFILTNEGNQIMLVSEPSRDIKIEEDMDFFNEVLFSKESDQNFNSYQYGLCAYKNNEQKNIFASQSLQLFEQ